MIRSIAAISLMFFEVLIAELLFSPFLEKRRRFPVLLAVSILVCLEIIIMVPLLYGYFTDSIFVYGDPAASAWDSVFKFLYYLLVFALTFLCCFVCFRCTEGVWKILFYCAGGYAIQHLSYNVSNMIGAAAGVRTGIWSHLIEVGVCAVVYVVAWLILVYRRRSADNSKSIKAKTLFSLLVLFVCIGLSRITTDDGTRGSLAFWAESLYAVISCILIIGMLFSITQNDRKQNEVDMMAELLHREKEQFRLVKENIDIINIKCHDLKHQLSALRGNLSEEYVKEIENAVMIYNSSVKTGNDILDVILTEKSLFCEKNHVCLTCAVNGAQLAFMDNMDIYSLFGNALSNAIESVSRIDDEERRCISLSSKTSGGFFSVHIENFYDGELQFENGLPLTRGDKNYHGFGLKSMKHIAEKYGGCMSVTAADGKFCLDFLFPPDAGEYGRRNFSR